MTTTPHYLRVARALALLGGVGGLAGCPGTTTLDTDAAISGSDASASLDAPRIEDAPVAATDAPMRMDDDAGSPGDAGNSADAASPDDASSQADAADVCASCICWGFGPPDDTGTDAGLPDCLTVPGAGFCCAAIGPLLPPDLAV